MTTRTFQKNYGGVMVLENPAQPYQKRAGAPVAKAAIDLTVQKLLANTVKLLIIQLVKRAPMDTSEADVDSVLAEIKPTLAEAFGDAGMKKASDKLRALAAERDRARRGDSLEEKYGLNADQAATVVSSVDVVIKLLMRNPEYTKDSDIDSALEEIKKATMAYFAMNVTEGTMTTKTSPATTAVLEKMLAETEAMIQKSNDILAQPRTHAGRFANLDDPSTAADTLDTAAKSLANSEPGLSYEQAYSRVLDSPEGQRLYRACDKSRGIDRPEPVQKLDASAWRGVPSDDDLDSLAKSIQTREPGLTYEQAYVQAMDSAEGRKSYEVYTDATASPEAVVAKRQALAELEPVIAKQRGEVSFFKNDAEVKFDLLVQKTMRSDNLSYPDAFDRVVKTTEGRELYNKAA